MHRDAGTCTELRQEVVHSACTLFAACSLASILAMSANHSHRKRSSAVLRWPVSRLAGSFLHISCACGRSAWLHASDLATHGPDLILAEAIRRLRCSGCGKPPLRVVLAARYPPQRGDEAGWLMVRG